MDNQLDVLGISHLGLAVTAPGAVHRYLGAGAWHLQLVDSRRRGRVRGRSRRSSSRGSTGSPGYPRLGGLCLELVETVTGETCHSKSAEVFGPGLHHVAFWVNDLDREVEKALSMGLTVTMAPSPRSSHTCAAPWRVPQPETFSTGRGPNPASEACTRSS